MTESNNNKKGLLKGLKYHISGLSVFEIHFLHLLFLTPLVFIFTASFIFNPDDFEQKKGILFLAPNCSYKQLTEKPCLTCGMTRAFSSISHGNIKAARKYNKGAIICYYLLVSIAIMLLISYIIFICKKLKSYLREKHE